MYGKSMPKGKMNKKLAELKKKKTTKKKKK
jgi:hypothetical protein